MVLEFSPLVVRKDVDIPWDIWQEEKWIGIFVLESNDSDVN